MVTWSQGELADPMLSAVSVFDSRTANVHVENTNDLAYTPLPLRILAGLAQTCQEVKAMLSAEIQTLEQQTPAALSKPECKPDTAVGKAITALSGKTKPDAIEKLADLNAQEGYLLIVKLALGGDRRQARRRQRHDRPPLPEGDLKLWSILQSAGTDKARTGGRAFCVPSSWTTMCRRRAGPAIDVFVEELGWGLGFERALPEATGLPAYRPRASVPTATSTTSR
jgi:hypothetical protein